MGCGTSQHHSSCKLPNEYPRHVFIKQKGHLAYPDSPGISIKNVHKHIRKEDSNFLEAQNATPHHSEIVNNNSEADNTMKIQSLTIGQLFVDFEFPPKTSSLFYNNPLIDGKVTWMRPHELINNPHLLVDGVSQHDIIQGILADCWFLSSCAAVAQHPDLMKRVIPSSQPLYGTGYKGFIWFQFWQYGKWITVYIDDLLPTKDGRLIFSRCSDNREFWVALLEKAYAKLHRSYEALEGGQAMDALVDLTGGLAERYDLDVAPFNLYDILLKASSNGAFITCSRKGDWRTANVADRNGLVAGHAYTVTGVASITLKNGEQENLLRIRNPWGNDVEWNGKWNDNDLIWSQVKISTKHQLQWKKKADGEFWMNYSDFCNEFEEVTVCTIGPDFNGDGTVNKTGYVCTVKGCWEEGCTAGGSRNNLELFSLNPQYLLTVLDITECPRISMIIALMQIRQYCKKHNKSRMLQIGFAVYKTKNPHKRLSRYFFVKNSDVGNSGPYINYREIFRRFEMNPGSYVIIPATFEPNCPGSFLIRIYADSPFRVKELK